VVGLCVVFALVCAHVATAALGPSATTGGVENVTATSATLTGKVNPEGTDTNYHFEYGTTTAYGAQTPSQDAGSGTTDKAVSASISSLSPNTTYHYRLVAKNVLGLTADGADKTFTTAPSAPAATTGGTNSVSSTSATLTGSVNPYGEDTTYYFEYGTTRAYGAQTPSQDAGSGTTTVNVSASIGPLTPSTTYHYRLVAQNAAGLTDGFDKTFRTPAPQPPAVKTGDASSVTATSANLAGIVNPQGQPTTYYFQYGPTTAYGAQTASGSAGAGTTAGNVSAQVGSLSPKTTYHYRLVAANATGTTYGADRTFATASGPPPPAATTGTATAVTATSATVAGVVSPRGNPTAYYFQYGPTTAYGSQTSVGNAGSGANNVNVSAPIGPLSPSKTYHYRLVATNSFGTAYGADMTLTTSAPSRVTLAAAPRTLVFGQVTWLNGTALAPGPVQTMVTLQQGRSAAGPFVNVQSAFSVLTGEFVFGPLSPSSTTYYRAVAAGAASAPVAVDVRFLITLSVSNSHPRRGRLVRFHGTVAPAHPGGAVLLQWLGPKHRWQTIRRLRLHRGRGVSVYSTRIRPGHGGKWRAVVLPDAGNAKGFSSLLRLHLRPVRPG